MKKILICGATGFIGRNLLEHFADSGDYIVKAVWNDSNPCDDWVKNKVEWVKADLTKKEDVKNIMRGIDVVLHYAAFTTNIKDGIEKPYLFLTYFFIVSILEQLLEISVIGNSHSPPSNLSFLR